MRISRRCKSALRYLAFYSTYYLTRASQLLRAKLTPAHPTRTQFRQDMATARIIAAIRDGGEVPGYVDVTVPELRSWNYQPRW